MNYLLPDARANTCGDGIEIRMFALPRDQAEQDALAWAVKYIYTRTRYIVCDLSRKLAIRVDQLGSKLASDEHWIQAVPMHLQHAYSD